MHLHMIVCPTCHGYGDIYHSDDGGGRNIKWRAECIVCRGMGEIVDLSKCGVCGTTIVPDGNEGVFFSDSHRKDVAICGPCNGGETDVVSEAERMQRLNCAVGYAYGALNAGRQHGNLEQAAELALKALEEPLTFAMTKVEAE